MKINISYPKSGATHRGRVDYLVSYFTRSRKYTLCTPLDNPDVTIKFNDILGPVPSGNNKKIFDLSDNILTIPRNANIFKKIYFYVYIKSKIIQNIKKYDQLVVACEEQKKLFRLYNKNIIVIPDTSFYHSHFKEKKPNDIINFVWEGQVQNFLYIYDIISSNKDIFRRRNVLITIITDRFSRNGVSIESKLSRLKINFKFIKWDSNTFINRLRSCDIGLAPLDIKCRHCLSKPFNKLVNYQGLGKPVIASNIPSYIEFKNNSPGYIKLCKSMLEWKHSLENIVNNDKHKEIDQILPYNFVKKRYSEKYLLQKWQSIL